MSAPRARLDVVRLDVLLHCLGGFAEPPQDPPMVHALPEKLWRQLEALAALPKYPYGSVTLLAERWGRRPKALHVQIHYIRRHGYRPQYRGTA